MTTVSSGAFTWAFVEIQFSSAQISNLLQSPILAIPANLLSAAVPLWITVTYTPNTVAFTGGGTLYCWYGNTQPSSTTVNSITNQSLGFATTCLQAGLSTPGTGFTLMAPKLSPSLVNQPLYVGLLSDTPSNYTGGNGSIVMIIQYMVNPTLAL